MAHPDWALKHKTKGTELRNIRGKYYLYKYTTKWDKELKKTKKMTLGQIGVITEEEGLIPTGEKRRGRVPAGESVLKNKPLEEKEPKKELFLDIFSQIEDPRAEKNQLHTVSEILLVAFCAIICGADGWEDIEQYGKSRISHLREYLDYKNGAPSNDTIRRFFRALDCHTFEALFREWVTIIAEETGTKVIAIDGKSSRHSFDGEKKMIHTVSAFCAESKIVLGQEKVLEKSNEIEAIPRILDWLDVKNHIITIDSMGCQYKIANKILRKEGNYIFSLKGNQGNLNDDVRLYFEDKQHIEKCTQYIDYDKGHGRIETRECFVSNDTEWLIKINKNWSSIKSIIKINSTRELKNGTTTEARYYISSLDVGAKEMLKHIRSHWSIENSLHWVLDMSFQDDQSRIREGNAPQIMVIMRHIATNTLQTAKSQSPLLKGKSIKILRKICGWDQDTLSSILSRKFS